MTDASGPNRAIGVPTSISAVAAEQLATMMALDLAGQAPPTDDDGWRQLNAFTDEMLLSMIPAPAPGTSVTTSTLGDVTVYDVDPHIRSYDLVCLYFHGGALTMGAGATGGAMTAAFAEGAQIRSIGVDYRMPPDHPHPAALDDSVAAYRALLDAHDPAKVVVAGVSAGGNLAPAMVLRARDEGLPLPAGMVMLSPEVDLTESGDTFETLMGVDPVIRARLEPTISLYARDHDRADPALSPLFGDFSTGFPATFLQSGTRDVFLSNTVRFHRALRRHAIEAELHVFEAMPHGGFGSILEGGLGQAPEDREVYEELRRFLAARSDRPPTEGRR